ncbi:hypothetical protein [Stagnihabitans tardus]|uniref:Uncharacterized protein n=1 Tax=Stagnihabitans tardus TaxID=2699202 RepID=A0AAE4YAD8_9RHOB|nr:hypothetical protein [Stagnihabitans tardus]NBZ88977.1 hypothetical protein [Stagnihabitans tardus]
MKQHISRIVPILAVFVVSLMALGATVGVAVLAHEGTRRVAVFATSETWLAVRESGLPVVKLALGGMLIVVDGVAAPEALERLRAGTPFLLDASLIPGCESPGQGPDMKVRS